jgi:ribosomal protein L12E/L44/L45/RPP1/RPP2
MAVAVPEIGRALSDTDAGRMAARLADDLRIAMEGELETVRARHETYLNWYSPPYDHNLRSHDSWNDPLSAADIDTTRSTFTISRAVVELWASLEAAKPPTVRGEPERVQPPLPFLTGTEAMQAAAEYDAKRRMESANSDIRSARIRRWMRDDQFALKHHRAVRRKNLFGYCWAKVLPQPWNRRPETTVLRNGTTVYPLWSTIGEGELDAVLSAQLMSARLAHARWPELPLTFPDPRNPRAAAFERGQDVNSGSYRDLNDRWFDQSRMNVWVEELWWIDRKFDTEGRLTESTVHTALRVLDRIVYMHSWKGWTRVPFVFWENTDERDSWGWSDIANVIDINDEFNRRVSQEGDVIRMFSAPRYQFLGGIEGRQVDFPAPFEMIPLQDQERIEQILTRIDVYPTQIHFDILTDLLHRVSGLPPIVWGLINNAQTSGRALSASWKATEARLLPKLMRNEQSCRQWLAIVLDQARYYDWYGAKEAFKDTAGEPFDDFTWSFPPMEPRDFTEVTMNEITKRDAGLTSTVRAMRATGTEDAEDALQEVMMEFDDINIHPEKKNAKLIAQQAEMQNIQMAMQLQQGAAGPAPAGPAPGAPAGPPPPQAAAPPGMEGQLPPTMPGAEGNAGAPTAPPGGDNLSSGTLVRGNDVSTQFLSTQQWG